tara:strand:+ start:128 stop:433 length:306 start_codon:yes stop_codon:yes gene_type:complete
MEIITSVPKYSDGEVDRAFMREIKNGYRLEVEREKYRTEIAAKEAQEHKGKTHPILGKCVATIPARDFFRLTNKYGHDEVHSKEFIKHYNKTFPRMSPNKA